jgi:hypothetical protein
MINHSIRAGGIFSEHEGIEQTRRRQDLRQTEAAAIDLG